MNYLFFSDEDATETANFKYNDLTGNCLAILQKSTAASSGRQISEDQTSGDQTSGDQTSGDQTSGDQTSGDQTSGDQNSGGQNSGGQTSGGQTTAVDDGGCSVLATTTTNGAAETAETADTADTAETVVSGQRRSGRLIMAPRPLTRTFNTIALGDFVILSTGTGKVDFQNCNFNDINSKEIIILPNWLCKISKD